MGDDIPRLRAGLVPEVSVAGMKLSAHRATLPGNVEVITGSAFLSAYKVGHPVDLPVNARHSKAQTRAKIIL